MGAGNGTRWSRATSWAGLGLLLALTAGCSNHAQPSRLNTAAPPTSQAPGTADSAADGSVASDQPTDNQTSAAPVTLGSSFNWADPNGYQFKISISFGHPGIADPIAGCTGGDAPPGTTNVPFTLTITNLLPDRSTALPLLEQDLTGLAPNPHPAGASAFVSETDGSACGNSVYGLAGREQTTGAITAGGQVTIQGIVYAAPLPLTSSAAMTFTSIYDSSTPVATIPLPISS